VENQANSVQYSEKCGVIIPLKQCRKGARRAHRARSDCSFRLQWTSFGVAYITAHLHPVQFLIITNVNYQRRIAKIKYDFW